MARPQPRGTIDAERQLARRIAYERNARGMTYEALANEMTRVGRPTASSALYKIEKSSPPRKVSVDELVALSKVFGTSLDDLLTDVDLLQKQRARELVERLTPADVQLSSSIQDLLDIFADFFVLATDDPDIHEYARGHWFGNDDESAETPFGPPQFVEVVDDDGVSVGLDKFNQGIADFYWLIIETAGRLAGSEFGGSDDQ